MSDDIPSLNRIRRITKEKLTLEFFKLEENIECIFSFILNPTKYICSEEVIYIIFK